MAAKTAPWWRMAVQFVLKGIRAVGRMAPRPRGALDEPAFKELDADTMLQNESEERTLSQESPKPDQEIAPAPAPEIESAAPHTEAAEAADEQASAEAPPEAVADILAQAVIPAQSAPEPAEAVADSEPAIDPPPALADLLAQAALPAVDEASPAPEPPQQREPEMEATPEPAVAYEIESPELGAVEAATKPVEAAPSEAAGPIEQHPAEALETQPGTSAEVQPQAASAAPQVPAPQVPQHREAIKKEEGPDTLPVSVFVNEVYEGPFDLLLDLIRKQDIDIYDIPIAKITAQFLAYVNRLKASDMDVAGEFIYTASLLIHIKSKMLLPRNPATPGEEAEDPRRELVERLLEHERFKNAAQMLQQKQELESASWTNPGMREFREDAGAEPEIAADTVDLVRIFREILERARSRPILNVQEDSVTVGQMIQFLGRRLTMEDKPVALRRLLAHTKSERALIAMFLALLELVRLQAILLRQDKHFSEIFIKKNSGFDAVMNEGLARDDWQ